MKKLRFVVLVVIAALLAGRFWQEMPVNAQVGGGDPACEQDRTLHSIDSNADGTVDLSDAVHLLTWLFSGGPEPQVCLAQAQNGGGLTPEQAEILSHMSIVELSMGTDIVGNVISTAKTIRFTGVNVQIVNGLGATNGNPDNPNFLDPAVTATNGLGNMIVGYNEERPALPEFICEQLPRLCQDIRTGSHSIVVGWGHNYSSFGGLVVGQLNTISGPYSSVSGGKNNTASGESSSVSGGGNLNEASGDRSSVSGGNFNTASGQHSSGSGGQNNTASGRWSSVSGGGGSEEGQGNVASGRYSTVSGGRGVTATGEAEHAP